MLLKKEGTILAQGEYLSLDTRKTQLNNNIMLVGASGRGKTRNFIKPNIMQMNCNYVISDPKGVLIYELGDMLEKNGYKIKVLNLIDMWHSDTYNPFVYLREDTDVFKLIDYLIENLFQGKVSNDPFWINSMKALVSSIFFFLIEACPPEERTLANAMKWLREGLMASDDGDSFTTLDYLFKAVEERYPNCVALKQYRIFRSVADAEKTTACIVMEALILLQHFNLTEYQRLTSTDTITLENISYEKTALFVITSDTDRSKNWLAGLFYSQLFDILCRQENQIHVRFILDDFVCTGRIPDFDYKMAMIRSRNLSCVVVVQDEAQLEKEYGQAAQGIITNCDSYVFLGASNIDICNTVAHRLANPRISGSDLRRMDYDTCVAIVGNTGGLYKKYRIEKHPCYCDIADSPEAANRYNLYDKKDTSSVARQIAEAQNTENNSDYCFECKETALRKSMFDSDEEERLHRVIRWITNTTVCVHQHLRDIFSSDVKSMSKKLSYMHCDFVVRDSINMEVMFGVEIDGWHHDEDKRQIVNDRMKDSIFEANNVPLLRFKAREVRENIHAVVDKIIETANSISKYTCILDAMDPNKR